MSARFTRSYALLATGLLALELYIAGFVHDSFVRPILGDSLATVLLYCLLRTCWRASVKTTALVALLLSYAIEGGQALHLLAWLGWQHARVARLVLGSQFAWEDMVAYSLGAAGVLVAERWRAQREAAQ